MHSSDLHVGEGFTEPVHKGDGTAGLRVVLAASRAAKADAVILAGDTFEHNRLSAELLDRAAAMLAEAKLPVVILPGNHDPAIADLGLPSRDRRAEERPCPWRNRRSGGFVSRSRARDLGQRASRLRRQRPAGAAAATAQLLQVAVAHGHYAPVADRSTNLRPGWLIGDDESSRPARITSRWVTGTAMCASAAMTLLRIIPARPITR